MSTKAIKDLVKTAIPNSFLVHRLPQKTPNSILLTFDDGPNEKITPQVLERLEKYNVRAVFFVVGREIKKQPHIIDLILSKGHVIGNHTYSHPHQKMPPLQQYRHEMIRCQEIIKTRSESTPMLYRSPMGILSLSGLLIAKSLQLKTVLWSIEGGEWGVNKEDDAETLGNRLKKNLQPRDIVLLHDDNIKMPVILDIILPDLKKRGIDLYNGVKALCP